MIKPLWKKICAGVGVAAVAGLVSYSADAATIKVAVSEPMSGPFATLGPPAMNGFVMTAEELINKHKGYYKGNTKIEVVPFDNKISPKEALINLQKAIDEGIRVFIQGQSSSIANALIGAVEKHNKRHPDDPVVYLNWAAVTPAFTNENCMFWHFRFDAHVDMKMAALVTHISGDKNVKKIYLINQNYAFGQSVSEAAKRLLKERMPGVEVVGDDLFPPFGKVKDFSPYITKIKASGADTVITGNWGLDLDRLLKAAFDAGLEAQWLTYYGGATGGPGAIGKRGIGKVKQVNEWHNNHLVGNTEMVANMYKEKYGNELTFYRLVATLEMLATAADKAGNTKIVDIAKALEGMEWDSGYGKVMMRASDHQLQSPLVISVLTDDVKYDMDGAGVAFKTVQVIDTKDTTQPTTCKMERP